MSRQNKQVENFDPNMDAQGNVTSLVMRVSYQLVDDMDNDTVGRSRTIDIWPFLTANQKTMAQAFITGLVALANSKF